MSRGCNIPIAVAMGISGLTHKILNDVMSPSVGCTELGAIALAAAIAYKAVGGTVEQIKVLLDSNTFKNAVAVTIPNTGGETGIDLTVALGAICGNPELKLSILRDIRQEDTEIAKEMVCQNKIQVDIQSEQFPIYIDTIVETSRGWGRAIIKGSHVNVVFIEANGEVKLGSESIAEKPQEIVVSTIHELLTMKVSDIIHLAATLGPGDIQFLIDGADMNMAIAEKGLSKRHGLTIGANLRDIVTKGLLADDLANQAKILTAAAVGARVTGSNLPVMTSGGSGNQGIAIVIPTVIAARKMGSDEPRLTKALALSHLFAAYTRYRIGELSTICPSVVAAAIGAGVGIFSLFDKSEEEIEKVVNTIVSNVIANIAGILCYGANETCALKLATASGVAVETAFLAEHDMAVITKAGIIGDSVEETLDNLVLICQTLRGTQQKIVSIIMQKLNQRQGRFVTDK